MNLVNPRIHSHAHRTDARIYPVFKLEYKPFARMSDLFGNLTGITFPEVAWNQGPLPSMGGLPAPLHQNPDARINYNSTLLGDLQPYAYGEPGYLSSQLSYLNIPHRIQKFIPVLYLPEPNGRDIFRLSHAVDDGDIAFTMRLNRHSVFCTGSRASTRATGMSTTVDPLINLSTLNYILACIQTSFNPRNRNQNDLWVEFLNNLDSARFGPNRTQEKFFNFSDLQHIVHRLIKPFGIVRGSEKQGGQSEMTLSPATWPVAAICTLVLDGKEGNVINIWYNHNIGAGDDLVLRWKLMPAGQYTLNHYYKGFARKNVSTPLNYVWQLVPDVFSLDNASEENRMSMDVRRPHMLPYQAAYFFTDVQRVAGRNQGRLLWRPDPAGGPAILPHWQELGFWRIGRSQVMVNHYGVEPFYKNDQANSMKTNHLELTFQPVYDKLHGHESDALGAVPAALRTHLPDENEPVLGGKFTDELMGLPEAEIIAEPIAESLAEPIAEPLAEPIAEPLAEPLADSFTTAPESAGEAGDESTQPVKRRKKGVVVRVDGSSASGVHLL
jgi:hypothetical protein